MRRVSSPCRRALPRPPASTLISIQLQIHGPTLPPSSKKRKLKTPQIKQPNKRHPNTIHTTNIASTRKYYSRLKLTQLPYRPTRATAQRLLRLLLNRCRSVSHAVRRRCAWAASLRLCRTRLGLFTLVVVILVHVHVASGWLVMLGSLGLGRLRHARQWSSSSHRRERRWVVSSLRWVVTIVEPSGVRSILWALTRHLRR